MYKTEGENRERMGKSGRELGRELGREWGIVGESGGGEWECMGTDAKKELYMCTCMYM